jgi:hypothetical protein
MKAVGCKGSSRVDDEDVEKADERKERSPCDKD